MCVCAQHCTQTEGGPVKLLFSSKLTAFSDRYFKQRSENGAAQTKHEPDAHTKHELDAHTKHELDAHTKHELDAHTKHELDAHKQSMSLMHTHLHSQALI